MDIQPVQRRIPRHFREYKYQQNKPVSEQRKLKKEERRQQTNQKHRIILEQYKLQYKYYDLEADEWQKQKYYFKISSYPTYEQLNQLVSSTFHHARRRQNIFPIVDRHPDFTLRCVYSGRLLSDSEGHMLQKCDEQHSFPQSFQRGTKSGTGMDMHAIFAACKSANGSRGNTPFGVYSQMQKQISTDEFGTNYSGYPLHNVKTYVPKINSGAVARSTLYILVCYRGCANPKYLPKQTLTWLINQASNSEVLLWQKHRNQQLYRLQGNRNPFIDHPEWAKSVNFSQGWNKNQ